MEQYTVISSGIYAILHIPTEKRYIGSTKCFEKRMRSHEAMLNGGRHHSKELQLAWDSSGENEFEFYQLENKISKDNLFAREQFWIDFFDSGRTGFNVLLIAGQQPWEDERFKWSSSRKAGKSQKDGNVSSGKKYPLLYHFKKYKARTLAARLNKKEGAALNKWFDAAGKYEYY
jgi:group I intron endonuclease